MRSPYTPSPKQICSRIGLALFCMLLAWHSSTLGLQWWAAEYAPGLLYNTWGLWLMSSGPLFLLGLPVFLLVLRTLPDGPSILRWKLPFGPKQYALAMVFCLGASYLINFITTLILVTPQGFFAANTPVVSPAQQMVLSGGFLPNFIFAVLLPSVGEETIFRYLIRRKMRGCPDSTYILFSALCFALFHGNIVQGLYTFVAGAMFAWAYVMTGKFWAPVSMHFLMNSIGVLPALALNTRALMVLVGLLVLGLLAGGIIVFFACRHRFLASLQAPAVAAWPYRPRLFRRPRRSSAYANWYAAYARGAVGRQAPPLSGQPLPEPWQAPAYGAGPSVSYYYRPACSSQPVMMLTPYQNVPPPPWAVYAKHPFLSLLRTVGMGLFMGLSLLIIVAQLLIPF